MRVLTFLALLAFFVAAFTSVSATGVEMQAQAEATLNALKVNKQLKSN